MIKDCLRDATMQLHILFIAFHLLHPFTPSPLLLRHFFLALFTFDLCKQRDIADAVSIILGGG